MSAESRPSQSIRTLDLAACSAVLKEVEGRQGNYDGMWRELRDARRPRRGLVDRVRARLLGPPENFEQAFERLRREVDPRRPYFAGETATGTRFMGDARDLPCALHALDPTYNSTLIDALGRAADACTGNAVDVGTNIGVVAVSLAKRLRGRGVVHAFEPSPETLKLAACTIAMNRVENVLLHHAAVSDSDGPLTFHATPGNSAIASARRHEFTYLNDWTEITVPACRLDTLSEQGTLGHVGLIKIDVEGHEMHALRGARALIRRERPTVVYEYTPAAAVSHGWTQEDSVQAFADAGPFDFEALSEADGVVRRFPLEASYTSQVNVFARPRSA